MDKNELAKIAKGLSSPTRIEIIELLRKNKEGLFLIDMVKIISKKSDYKSEFTSVKSHVLELVYIGVVDFTGEKGKYFVRLIKDPQITLREI